MNCYVVSKKIHQYHNREFFITREVPVKIFTTLELAESYVNDSILSHARFGKLQAYELWPLEEGVRERLQEIIFEVGYRKDGFVYGGLIPDFDDDWEDDDILNYYNTLGLDLYEITNLPFEQDLVSAKVLTKLLDWCKTTDCWSGESFYQNDKAQELSMELISELLDEVLPKEIKL